MSLSSLSSNHWVERRDTAARAAPAAASDDDDDDGDQDHDICFPFIEGDLRSSRGGISVT